VEQKQLIAIGIGLQTQVLKICEVHSRIFRDEEADPGAAFALGLELFQARQPYVAAFGADLEELLELLCETLEAAPPRCPHCNAPRDAGCPQSAIPARQSRPLSQSPMDRGRASACAPLIAETASLDFGAET
jgi:hypothetical protein